jgi:ABC-2 type transport system ATP-binding protein
MSEVAIEVDGLEKHYAGGRGVNGVTFNVAPGEVFGILGPNGAGKTTTVEILEGYRRADAGRARVLGLDPIDDGPRLRPQIGVMLQEGGLYPGLKPLEVLRLFAAFYDDAERPEAMLSLVGLDDVRRTTVRRLSGGQQQRLSLACALVGKPSLLFLDEPTAGMDPRARVATWDIVRRQRDLGRTVVLTTHGMDEAEHLCDRIAILANGRVAALGTPVELTHSTTTEEVVFSAKPALDTADIAKHLGLTSELVIEERPGDYLVRAAGTPDLVANLAIWMRDHDEPLGALQAGRRSLEDVFLQITAEQPESEPEPEAEALSEGAS